MMRKLLMALWVSAAFFSTAANALGLGELKLNSALNQPLDAEIRILNIGDLSRNELLPSLASHEAFARAGVERVFFLTDIKFDVQLTGDGNAVIKLTTNRIVREPFLSFLVELHWPSGRLLREYNVLFDPPVFSEAAAAPVQQARSAPAPRPQPATQTQPRTEAAAPAQPRVGDTASDTVRVNANDTLWTIARDHRPDESVSIRQTMLAIQRQNPNAFINNNINLLKAGQVLRIPSVDQIRSFSVAEAATETARQMEAWQQARATELSSPQQLAQERVATPEVETEEGNLLLLGDEDHTDRLMAETARSAAADTGDESAGVGPPGSGGTDTSLASATGSGGADVITGEEIEGLRQQVDDLRRLVSLKDEQLALLQAASSLPGNAEQAGMAMAEPAPVVNANNVPAAGAQPEEETIMDTLVANPIYVGVAILAVLAALVVFGALARRRSQGREYPQDLRRVLDHVENDVALPDELEAEFAEPALRSTKAAPAAAAVADMQSDREAASKNQPATEADKTKKVIEEADIYIAYGRYERAIAILQPAILANPSNTEVRLKMAEVYIATGNTAGLTQQEADLEAIGDIAALERLDEIKEKAAVSTSFGAVDDDAGAEETLDHPVEFDLDAAGTAAESEQAVQDDDLLEFSLDQGGEPESEEELLLEDTFDEFDDELGQGKSPKAEGDMDDFLVDTDEAATKLELARAYIEMGDADAAAEILKEVLADGNPDQSEEAQQLLDTLA